MKLAFPKRKEQDSVAYGAIVVSDLLARRNQIAHQNDRSHYNALQDTISKEYGEDYIMKIELIVEAIQCRVALIDANS